MDRAIIHIRVQPRASRNEVVRQKGDVWWIRLAAPPVEGKANAALVAFLSQLLGLPVGQVAIVRGAGSRQKVVAIQLLSEAEIQLRLRGALHHQ